jgi:hypothetical protein
MPIIEANREVINFPEADARVFAALLKRNFRNTDEMKNAFDTAYHIDRLNTASDETVRDTLAEAAGALGIDLGSGSLFSKMPDEQRLYTALLREEFPLNTDTARFIVSFEKFLALTAINSIDTTNRDKTGGVLEAFNAYYGLDLDGDYSDLSDPERVAVYKAVARENGFDSLDDVPAVVDRAVAMVIAERTQGKSASPGGGGGSGKTTVISMPPPAAEIPPVLLPPRKILDSDVAAWAAESIEALAAAGIIDGDENGYYRPNRPILREEFIKLVVSAFSLEYDGAEAEFADADKGQWYYPYISVAAAHGIVLGDDKNEFGAGKEITRQDMTVILYRTALLRGDLPDGGGNAAAFDDGDLIDDYAKDAFDAMLAAGVISGVGGNQLDPKGTATKAMAAKLLYALL